MPTRNVYLKIEQIANYSPVDPEQKVAPPKEYRRDCMRNPGHEDATIPQTEADARRLTALVYREYLDPNYLIPKPDKLVPADINEPAYHRRVPGTVIYTQPGELLRIHVLNGDVASHSLHVHGLRYGIDSDGSWPLGTQSSDGRRSDEICPGQRWTYTFDVTEQMVGAWPFHTHSRIIGENINRGLFGGIVVRRREHLKDCLPELDLPPLVAQFLRERERLGPAAMEGEDIRLEAVREYLQDWAQREFVHPLPHHPAVIEVPLFLHFMSGVGGTPAFDSGPLAPGAAPFEVTFGAAGTFSYHCNFHPVMQGTVTVAPGGPALALVNLKDSPDMKFDPATVTIAPGGKVRWVPGTPPAQSLTHTVTENAAGLPSYCFNGRSFVGNTPTIVTRAGQKIRWYVFNLDLGMTWHNFHPHAQRWQFANETIDVRGIGPAESFVVETTAPPVLLLPEDIEKTQDPQHRPKDAKEYRIRGDFLVHCHVETHMVQGLAGVVRSQQTLWLTAKQADRIAKETGLPLDPGTNACSSIDLGRCATVGCGKWEEVPGQPDVTMMHATLLANTQKVLYWGYHRVDQSRLWDPAGGYASPANQPANVALAPPDELFSNLHSAAHAYLDSAEGTLLAHGGESFQDRQAFLFHPATLTWERMPPTVEGRFYATTLTLADGKLLTLFGNGGPSPLARSIEVFDPGTNTWSAPKPLPANFDYIFYPWTYLLPGGELVIAGHQGVTRRFDWTATPIVQDPAKVWNTIAGDRSPGGAEKGTSVLLPLRPPGYEPRVLIAAGSTGATQQTAEMIDLSAPVPAWTALPNLNVPRPDQCTAVLLPDGKVFLAGGVSGSPGPAEIFDPADPAAGWMLCGPMKHVRGYHSSNILLADGSVLMGGDPSNGGVPTPHERFFPWYCALPRPVITNAPATIAHGAAFAIQTPDASTIAEVVLLRPGATTHGFNMSQRFVGCSVVGGGGASIQVQAPPDGNIAPPGWYLLFIVNGGRVPSVGRWIRLTP